MAMTNTVDIDFGNVLPRVQWATIHSFITSMGLDQFQENDITHLIIAGSQIARLKFHSTHEFESFLNKYGGLSYYDGLSEETLEVMICDPSLPGKLVRISNFSTNPERLPIVTAKLSEFGTVLEIRQERFKSTKDLDYYEVYNGLITARMNLTKEIPSYVMIEDQKVLVCYPGQIITCWVCNNPGHLRSSCPKKKKTRASKFNKYLPN